MIRKGISVFITIAVSILVLNLLSCSKGGERKEFNQVHFDLKDIQKRGKIIGLCRYSATSYFIYKGMPMGYEYELLSNLADHLGVELEIKVPKKWDDMYRMLYSGEGDIIAANMMVTLENTRKVTFAHHHSTTRQMLVQRKPKGWRQMKIHNIDKKLVRDPIQLIGKKVHVRESSAYYSRLKNLSQEVGGEIKMVKVSEDMETELLIKMVADGVIDYTVADENVVGSYEAYYPILDARTPLSFPQRVAWAVRSNAPELLKQINSWFGKMKSKKDPVYYVIYRKYFKNRRAFVRRLSSNYLSVTGGKISPYDSLFAKYSGEIGWDWKLVASLAFQESQFNPKAEAWTGAVGIMQLLPSTAEELGVRDPLNPNESIKGGVKLLRLLYAYWEDIPREEERIKFTLAAYNTGPGHIQDARRLAEKYGKDPNVWEGNVAKYLLKKSEKKYYFDDVVRNGYCRGEEPINFVKEVFERYEIYKQYSDYLDEKTASSEKPGRDSKKKQL
jgi:membrane-bound lytic murein transglycosylase F